MRKCAAGALALAAVLIAPSAAQAAEYLPVGRPVELFVGVMARPPEAAGDTNLKAGDHYRLDISGGVTEVDHILVSPGSPQPPDITFRDDALYCYEASNMTCSDASPLAHQTLVIRTSESGPIAALDNLPYNSSHSYRVADYVPTSTGPLILSVPSDTPDPNRQLSGRFEVKVSENINQAILPKHKQKRKHGRHRRRRHR